MESLPSDRITMWYKCLVCHKMFQFPNLLLSHRAESDCRFKYAEIHKERSGRRSEVPNATDLAEQNNKHSKNPEEQLKKVSEPFSEISNQSEIHEPSRRKPCPLSKRKNQVNLEALEAAKKMRTSFFEKHRDPQTKEKESRTLVLKKSKESPQSPDLQNKSHEEGQTSKSSTQIPSDDVDEDDDIEIISVGPVLPTDIPKVIYISSDDDEDAVEVLSDDSSLKPKSTEKFRCYFCRSNFRNTAMFFHHLQSHTKERQFFCRPCNTEYARSRELDNHNLITHKALDLQCPLCFKKFSNPETLITHCSDCNGDLEQEIPDNPGLSPTPAAEDTTIDSEIEDLDIASSQDFQCYFCQATRSSSKQLSQHLLTHLSERPYTCQICKRTFNRSRILKLHVSTAHKKADIVDKPVRRPFPFRGGQKRKYSFQKKTVCKRKIPNKAIAPSKRGRGRPKLTAMKRRSAINSHPPPRKQLATKSPKPTVTAPKKALKAKVPTRTSCSPRTGMTTMNVNRKKTACKMKTTKLLIVTEAKKPSSPKKALRSPKKVLGMMKAAACKMMASKPNTETEDTTTTTTTTPAKPVVLWKLTAKGLGSLGITKP